MVLSAWIWIFEKYFGKIKYDLYILNFSNSIFTNSSNQISKLLMGKSDSETNTKVYKKSKQVSDSENSDSSSGVEPKKVQVKKVVKKVEKTPEKKKTPEHTKPKESEKKPAQKEKAKIEKQSKTTDEKKAMKAVGKLGSKAMKLQWLHAAKCITSIELEMVALEERKWFKETESKDPNSFELVRFKKIRAALKEYDKSQQVEFEETHPMAKELVAAKKKSD